MPVTRLSPREAFARMTGEGFAYLDVRDADEFEDGHPAGAVNVPWGPGGEAFVAAASRAFAKDAPIVVGCQKGARSLRAAEALLAAGFTRVVEQRAGWDGSRGTFGELVEPGWRREGLPSSSGA